MAMHNENRKNLDAREMNDTSLLAKMIYSRSEKVCAEVGKNGLANGGNGFFPFPKTLTLQWILGETI